MSRPKPPIGISDFQKIIEGDYFYVDKSLFIKEVIEDPADILLFPRPRRFGKTLNMNMLKAFFEKAEDSKAALFKELAISQHSECLEAQGKHPVIYLTFKSTKLSKWNDCYEKMALMISNEVDRHIENYPNWNEAPISPNQKKKLERLASMEASPMEFQNSLQLLSRNLKKLYGKPVLLLIDEYDVPIQAAYHHGYYEDAIEFIRNFLTDGLKDNPDLYKAVLTGILRVARESIFSGLNNVEVYSILNESFSDKFGLTETEIESALEQFELTPQQKEVEQWYNGYGFGNQHIYNPWSIIHFLKNRDFGPYWINTSDNQIVSDMIEDGDLQLKKDLSALMNGEGIVIPLNEQVSYSDIKKGRKSIWNFLTFSGYLSVENSSGESDNRLYEVKIPNREVRLFFKTTLVEWFDRFSVDSSLDQMLNALIETRIDHFEKELKVIVDRVMSYHDIGKKEPERTYHIFVLGMLMHLESKYDIDSKLNAARRQSGAGRYDIMLIPRDKTSKGIVMEFKRAATEGQAQSELKAAMKQIKTKDYVQRLRSKGFQDNLGIGLVFCGKQVFVQHETI